MRAQKSGTIVNIFSIGGKIYEPLGGWYHATKFAVEGLSDSLRVELEPFGIAVVVVEPGAIRTEWGGIARDNLAKVSGHTAYSEQAKGLCALLASADKEGAGSEPSVIADAIATAVLARRPKTRYAAGAQAKPIILARRLLSDRAMDRLIRRVIKRGL